MSKKKKKARNFDQSASITTADTKEHPDSRNWKRRLRIFNAAGIVLIALSAWYGVTYATKQFVVLYKSTPELVTYFLFAHFIVIAIRWIVIFWRNSNMARFNTDPLFAKRIALLQMILSSATLFLIVSAVVYVSGITEVFTNYIVSIWPEVNAQAVDVLFSLASWLLSGIVGNAGYDLLKKLWTNVFSKPKSRRK